MGRNMVYGVRDWRWAILCALGPVCVGCGGSSDGSLSTLESDADALQETGFFSVDGGDDATAGCMRAVSLPAVIVGPPQPFDVVIVADNSDSLIGSRGDLAAGLPNFLEYVRGRAVRFFLLTSTQYGASSEAAISRSTGLDLATWSNAVTGDPYSDPMTTYAQTCTDTGDASIACPSYPASINYNLHGAWTFSMPAPIAAITPTMTDAGFAAQQQAVSSAILALGGGGANESQPICTLSRYMGQAPAALPSHVVFVVITDSDDTHAPSDCLAKYDYTAMAAGTNTSSSPCSSSHCDEYLYTLTAPGVDTLLEYNCVPVDDDGVAHPAQGVPHTLWTGYASTCGSPASGSCTADEVTSATNDCSSIVGSNYVVQNCTFACMSEGTNDCTFARTDNATNLCSQSFDSNGVTYANLAAYCAQTEPGYAWSTCTVTGYDNVSSPGGYYQSEELTPVVPVTSAADMVTQFKASAAAAFGDAGYQVETIQLDPSFSCPVGAGQSYGANLKTLASSPTDVFPLCGDYSAALEQLKNFADSLVQTSYPVTLDANETVTGVTAVGAAGNRALASADYSYDRNTSTLHIASGVLGPGDASLLVSVTADCVAH